MRCCWLRRRPPRHGTHAPRRGSGGRSSCSLRTESATPRAVVSRESDPLLPGTLALASALYRKRQDSLGTQSAPKWARLSLFIHHKHWCCRSSAFVSSGIECGTRSGRAVHKSIMDNLNGCHTRGLDHCRRKSGTLGVSRPLARVLTFACKEELEACFVSKSLTQAKELGG